MSERKSKPVTKNTIPNRPRLGLRGLGQVQVFAHNSLRTLTQQSSQKGITETENSQILLRNSLFQIGLRGLPFLPVQKFLGTAIRPIIIGSNFSTNHDNF